MPRALPILLTRWNFLAQLPLALPVALAGLLVSAAAAAESSAATNYHKKVEPLLSKYCYDCHGNGIGKGQVAFDEFASDAELLAKRELWLAALKNVRAGTMPPLEEDVARPSEAEITTLANWIKYEAFGTDPANPDPGRVTARRLNRIEYRNTIRDLMGGFAAETARPSPATLKPSAPSPLTSSPSSSTSPARPCARNNGSGSSRESNWTS